MKAPGPRPDTRHDRYIAGISLTILCWYLSTSTSKARLSPADRTTSSRSTLCRPSGPSSSLQTRFRSHWCGRQSRLIDSFAPRDRIKGIFSMRSLVLADRADPARAGQAPRRGGKTSTTYPNIQSDSSNESAKTFDVLIIGSGGAGLSLALRLPARLRVAVLSKDPSRRVRRFMLKAAVSAVLDKTIPSIARRGHAGCRCRALRTRRLSLYRGARARSDPLAGGPRRAVHPRARTRRPPGIHADPRRRHSHRRVIPRRRRHRSRHRDHTVEQVRQCPNVTLFEDHIAVDLITRAKLGLPGNQALGAYVLDRGRGKSRTLRARSVVRPPAAASQGLSVHQ